MSNTVQLFNLNASDLEPSTSRENSTVISLLLIALAYSYVYPDLVKQYPRLGEVGEGAGRRVD